MQKMKGGKSTYNTISSHPNLGSLPHSHEKQQHEQAKFNRSSSVGPGLHASNLNPTERTRRMMYVNMPFISVYGMQFKTQSMAKSLSRLSLAGMAESADESERQALLESASGGLEKGLSAYLMAAVGIACGLMFLVGLNTSIMNSLDSVVFPGHSTLEWSLAVSVFAVGGPFGAVLAGMMANMYGRRAAILIDMWLFLAGGILLALAPSMAVIIVARLIIGFSSGFASVIVPIYLGELAPPSLRGTLGTLTQFSMVTGILAANLLSFPLATLSNWRYLFGTSGLMALTQVLASPFIFESPRWLLNRDAHSLEARLAIKRLNDFKSDEEVQVEVDHIVKASEQQRLKGQSSAHSAGAVMQLLGDKRTKRLVIGFIVLHVAQQLSGINAVFYYSTMFFKGVVDQPKVATAACGLINVIATYVALQLMDRCGRVTLLLISTGGMLASCVVITISLLGYAANMMALMGVLAFVSFFEIGLGPIPWLIGAEMFDAKNVATAMSIASQVNWACNFLVGIGFPYINDALGPWVFAPFGLVLLLTYMYVLVFLPETAGRTHQEIKRLAGGSVSIDDFEENLQIMVVEGVDLGA